MPITFHIDNNIGIYITKGDVEFSEGMSVLLGGLQEIKSKLESPLILFDLRESEENRSSNEISSIADVVGMHVEGAKVAMLVNRAPYFGLSRVFEAYVESSNVQTRVFKEYEDALSWLME